MLTTCLVMLSTAAWAQESDAPAPPPLPPVAEQPPPAEPAPAPPPPADPPPLANPPPWGGPGAQTGAQRAPGAMGGHGGMGGHSAMGRKSCQSWEIAVWNPKASGCAARPDASGDDWCAVPEGMKPIQPVGDSSKWWVMRCADPEPAGPPVP